MLLTRCGSKIALNDSLRLTGRELSKRLTSYQCSSQSNELCNADHIHAKGGCAQLVQLPISGFPLKHLPLLKDLPLYLFLLFLPELEQALLLIS